MKNAAVLPLALALCVLSLQAQAAPSAKADAPIVRRLFVLPNADRVVGEEGFLKVPETAKPGARKIEIAFARLRSTSAHAGPPIFFIEGGPGASSIETITTKPDLVARLRTFGDVVFVDQRGAGEARENLDCAERWALPLDRPLTREVAIADTRRIFAACRKAWAEAGADLDGYNTAAYADDLFRVADALGYGRVRLYAFSYGTQIALSAVSRHADRVERAAVFGVMGPDNSLRQPADEDAVLARAAKMLAASAQGAAYPDLRELVRAALGQVRSEPVAIPDARDDAGHPVAVVMDEEGLQSYLIGVLGNRKKIGGLPKFLKVIADRGDLAAVAPQVKDYVSSLLWERRGPAQRRTALQQYATVCASGISDASRRRLFADREPTLMGQTLHYSLPEACDALAVKDIGEAERAAPPSQTPLLVVGGTLDTKTPLAQAEAVARRFPHAALLVVDGAAHGDLPDQPAITPQVSAFFSGQTPVSQTISLPALKFDPPA